MLFRLALVLSCVVVFETAVAGQTVDASSQVSTVTSNDGTRIALECTGKGPSLLIIHGGSGDRKRWKPLLPLFAPHFAVCAMDRRGHGESERGLDYSLQKEFEDVVAAVKQISLTAASNRFVDNTLCSDHRDQRRSTKLHGKKGPGNNPKTVFLKARLTRSESWWVLKSINISSLTSLSEKRILRFLCALCVSAVNVFRAEIHRRVAEGTEISQRKSLFPTDSNGMKPH